MHLAFSNVFGYTFGYIHETLVMYLRVQDLQMMRTIMIRKIMTMMFILNIDGDHVDADDHVVADHHADAT